MEVCAGARPCDKGRVVAMYEMSSSLALRSLLKSLAAREGVIGRPRSLHGLTIQAKAFVASALAHEQPAEPVVLVVPTDAEIDTVIDDVRFFLGALDAASDAAVAAAVLPLPSLQVDPYRALAPHMRVTSARARALLALASGRSRVIVASGPALLPRLPAPDALVARSLGVKTGGDVDPQSLAALLIEGGYERQDPVDQHGEFCLRGGILDVYPPNELWPVRIEFIGDMVESIRRFDPDTQRSVETLDQFVVVPVRESSDTTDLPLAGQGAATIFDYLSARRTSRLLVSEPDEVAAAVERTFTQAQASYDEARLRSNAPVDLAAPPALFVTPEELASRVAKALTLSALDVDDAPASHHVPSQPIAHFHGRIPDWIAEVRERKAAGEAVLFIAHTAGRAERTIEMLADYDVRAELATRASEFSTGAVLVVQGGLSHGVRFPQSGVTLYAETDLFDDDRHRGSTGRRRSATAAFLSDLRDLKQGDLIVHVDNGIGEFVGLKQIGVGDTAHEFLELRYHGDDKLFVPVERLDLVQKYTGGSRPALDKLGGTSWAKAKTKVKKAMRDMAEELLKLYAARKAVPGHAFSADTHWQEEFEAAFPYELTPDQATAVADIKRDMESPTPMDRLLCGDVGYGKTEVALRAAFKAVMDGKQVAVLAPTTVLAFQHLETLKARFAAFPVRVDMVSRFRTKGEQAAILEQLAGGHLDILVGTHRLLSKDVQFRDLGLLVVDEEQRFGVAHKERIKQMRRKVDVLTLTATPIPRTLNMSLVGIRDMSVIETAPKDRLSIQTHVVKFDQGVVTRALRTELARGGQVYFVHNRVESIFSMANLLQRLVPEARIVVGHGQMGDDTLEKTMFDFVAHKYDVLLSTTIVENGLDIPNANTIVINRADRYGLSQLYQLRGRVGRSDRPAYAYLLIPPEETLSGVAKKRLAAIKEFSDLGSGFRIAALDLEIRGAGNLLGGEQSGQIDAVGFEMYMKLLEETVKELKGEDLDDDVRAVVNLKVDFRIPEGYMPDVNQRLSIYRRMASVRSEDDIRALLDELGDRYGAPPASVLNLADYGRVRVGADRLGLETIDRDGSTVVYKFRQKTKVDLPRLLNLVRTHPELQLVPPGSLKLDLKHDLPKPPGERPKPAWWTARATAGEVTSGFTKGDIQREAQADPRAEGGLLARVLGVLDALSDS
jgi:transcription-repair coupling factor (superfamily II helicase)